MRVLSFAPHQVPAAVRTQVAALEEQTWPREPGEPAGEHDPALRPETMVLVDGDGVVLASLAILSKEISHAGRRFAARGLSAVVTDQACRGRGHGLRLVTAARERIASSGADLGVFSCDRPLAGFYLRAGWQLLPGTVLVGGTPDDPLPSDRFDKLVLAGLFTEHAREHAASFEHARIELYPGTIDRLW